MLDSKGIINPKKKYLGNRSKNFIYGINPIEVLLLQQPHRIITIFIVGTSTSVNLRIKKIILLAQQHNISLQYIKEHKSLEQWFDGSVNHQGIAAKVIPLKLWTEKELLASIDLATNNKLTFMILDHIQDPRNLGACIRNAAAFGVDAVILPKDRSCDLTPIVTKVASGGVELVPIVKVTNLCSCLKALQERGIWVISLEVDQGENLYTLDLTLPIALVFGSEGYGIKELVKRHSDFKAKIPLANMALDSLNLAVASGICLYEVYRQRNY